MQNGDFPQLCKRLPVVNIYIYGYYMVNDDGQYMVNDDGYDMVNDG